MYIKNLFSIISRFVKLNLVGLVKKKIILYSKVFKYLKVFLDENLKNKVFSHEKTPKATKIKKCPPIS